MSKQDPYQCSNCESQFNSNYCPNCGRPKQVRRINGRYILSEIGQILNLEKGILFTIKELLLRPGDNIRQFIVSDRNRLVKPVVFVIVCSLVYSIVQQFLNFEDGYVNYSFDEGSASTTLFQWISNNYGYANILMAIFIAIWLNLFFRRYRFNFFEILILLCFMMGMGMLIFSIVGMIQSITDFKFLDAGFLIGILYICWGIGQFFENKKWFNFVKAFFCYMLGMFTFSFFVFGLGALIDILNN